MRQTPATRKNQKRTKQRNHRPAKNHKKPSNWKTTQTSKNYKAPAKTPENKENTENNKMNVDEWLDICEANNIKLIPASEGEKVPLVNWKEYEQTGPTKQQIQQWHKQYPNCNWAILCGKPSGNLTVLDFDNPENFTKTFPKKEEICSWTWVVKSPHGWHVYLRQPEADKSFKIPGYVECRSTGNIVIAPPSKLKDKQTGETLEYKFESRPNEIHGITDLPTALVKRAKELGYKADTPAQTEWLTTNFSNGWTGNEPPCITQLVQTPSIKGERDETAMRIAAYYANFCFDLQKARDKMTSWHTKIEQSTDPYSLTQALSKIEHVRNNKYIYGCNDPYLSRYCKETCQFKLGKKAKTMLINPEILNEIKQQLGTLIAGEDSNKLLLFLLCLSGKCKDPKRKQIIVVKGEPGGGKTHLTKTITKMYKTKTIGRFSAHALDYTDLEGYEILYLQELGNMDDEKNGVSTLKFLSADDQGYKIEVTVRDPDTNEFTTQEKIIPPITVITTTNRVEIDPQLERRAWPLTIDESKEQTKRIKDYKVQDVYEDNLILLGFQQKKRTEDAAQLLQKIISELDDCDIILPFPEALFGVFKQDGHGHIRVRGDFNKVKDLSWLLCFLLQKQLFKITEDIDKRPILFASPTATAKMLSIIEKPLLKMVGNISEHQEKILDAMEQCGITQIGDEIDNDKRQLIADKLDLTEHTIYSRLKDLARNTNLISSYKEKTAVKFVLKASLSDIKINIAEIVSLLKNDKGLALVFIKEAEVWLDDLLQNDPEGIHLKLPLLKLQEMLSNEKQSLIPETTPEQPSIIEADKGLSPIQPQKQQDSTVNQPTEQPKIKQIIQPKIQPKDYSKVVSCIILSVEDRTKDAKCPMCEFSGRTLLYSVQFFDGSHGDVCAECGSKIQGYLSQKGEIENE